MAVHVTAPGSSANVGPGFDALGIAVDLRFELCTGDLPGFHPAEPTHPAAVAYRAVGGQGDLWWKSPIPPGRGLGYSGAARVAGAYAALAEQRFVAHPDMSGADVNAGARQAAFECAATLEAHPDNAAASAFGGITVAVEDTVVGIDTPLDVQLVVWWPQETASTAKSRTVLPDDVPFVDAVFNVGHAALLVAALAAGDAQAVTAALDDRLHQRQRFEVLERSAQAYERFSESAAIGCWLSGSGPTVAALVARADADSVAQQAPSDGTTRILDIVAAGVHARCVDTMKGST